MSSSAALLSAEYDLHATVAARPMRAATGTSGSVSLIAVATLVAWAGCLGIGALGLLVPYTRPEPVIPPAPPVEAEVLAVELTHDPLPSFTAAPDLPMPSDAPPLAEPVAAPPMASLVPVAEPRSVEFAVPVEGPTRIVEAREAIPVRQPVQVPDAVAAPPVQQLTFGLGEGRQPAPEYPRRAVWEGQEGTVRVRFVVGPNGRVTSAEALIPCRWPLLNEAAVETVRERWRFRPGAVRAYEVSIRFALSQ